MNFHHSLLLRMRVKSFAVLALPRPPAEPQSATSLAGNRRVTREFCVRQTGSTKKKFVGSDCEWREKIVATDRAGEIILVHTIATYADRADKNTVAVKTKRTRENGDPIGEIWI